MSLPPRDASSSVPRNAEASTWLEQDAAQERAQHAVDDDVGQARAAEELVAGGLRPVEEPQRSAGDPHVLVRERPDESSQSSRLEQRVAVHQCHDFASCVAGREVAATREAGVPAGAEHLDGLRVREAGDGVAQAPIVDDDDLHPDTLGVEGRLDASTEQRLLTEGEHDHRHEQLIARPCP